MVVLVRVAAAGRRTGLYIPLFLFRSNTNLLTPIRSFVPALLTLKGVLPSVRHHPFERQPEQRYNTLDFPAGKSCANRDAARPYWMTQSKTSDIAKRKKGM